jgi:cytochrome c553
MKPIIAFAAGMVLAACAAAAEQDASALAAGVCSACHGPAGHSISPVFPNLAGQQAAYTMLQLNAFREHARGDPNAQAYMWGMASQLSDDTIKALADYYASQKPARVEAVDRGLLAEGEKIYAQGIKDGNVPACASCHGPNAEGVAAFPRLAGQHVEYLVAQLEGFKSGLRSNAPIMLGVVATMTSQQIKAVANYAATK